MTTSAQPSKSDRTRQRILRAAAKAFRQQGYTSSSLREIADSAGMQAGSLYYHFGSKEELAECVMDMGLAGARAAAEQALLAAGDDADPLTRIGAAFGGHLSYLVEEADFAVATLRMLHQTPDGVRTRHMRKQRALGRFYGELFEAARAAGQIRPQFDLSALRMLLLGALNWTPEWYSDAGLSPEQLAAQLTDMMGRGVRPQ